MAVRDAFQAKTSKCEEEPALRAVLEVKEALEKETKKSKNEELKMFNDYVCAVVSRQSRDVDGGTECRAERRRSDESVELGEETGGCGSVVAHFARALGSEVLNANVPARAVEKSLIGEKLMRPEVRRYENDILWSITYPNAKIVLSREEIRNECIGKVT